MAKKRKNEAWAENGFEDWGGYMAAKQAKLEEQFLCEAGQGNKTSNIFQGIAIFVNGYTDPTADELRQLMMTHGGIYHHYMRPRATTHIIASNLPYSKIIQYRKSQSPVPICKPEWIVHSIKSGKLLNFQNYLLYSQCTDVQPKLKYTIKDKVVETTDVKQKQSNIQKEKDIDDDRLKNIPLHENTEGMKQVTVNTHNTDIPSTITSKDTHSTKNSEFISEFYSHSRLHHIATMGATFKDYVNQLRDKNNSNFSGLSKLKELRTIKLNKSLSESQQELDNEADYLQEENKMVTNQCHVIMHIDMDCFFVSVGLRDKPHLRGVPVAVTHARGNKNFACKDEEHGSLSEVASCSYEARKVGVKNGMFLGEALKICPNLISIPYNFEGYTEVSYKLYDIVASYTLDIEAVSCDEMYADCTKVLLESHITPMEFASIIRQEIKNKTGCPVSTGFGSNKLLARLATKKAKPNGQFIIHDDEINDCINTFNVQDLPGVGWSTTHKLNSINVRTCAELRTIPLSSLRKEFGNKTGEMLYNMCRGIDKSKLNVEHIRKSVSAEVNYGIRFENNEDAIDFLKKLSHEVCNRLNKANAKGRCITLKLLMRANDAPKETEKFMGHGLCDYMTKTKNLISPINDIDIVTKEVITLWNQMQKAPEDARGIGIQISRLEISKSKSCNATLMTFVRNHQSGAYHGLGKTNNINETESRSVSNVLEINSKNETKDSKRKQHIPLDIDDTVINELPQEIRNEVLGVVKGNKLIETNKKKEFVTEQKINEKVSKKNVHTIHEHFFKQTKPGVSRPTKVEIPSIKEIDMSVLIELPEDIRNEILNEYSSKRSENQKNLNTNENVDFTPFPGRTNLMNNDCDAQNISFSQVDPEFLAALSDDLKLDVQRYCTAKKAERRTKVKEVETTCNERLTETESIKQNQKSEQNLKSKIIGKNSKTIAKSKKSTKQTVSKTVIKPMNNDNNISNDKVNKGIIKSIAPRLERIEPSDYQIPAEEAEAILSHNRTISENSGNTDKNQDVLINLVNRLLNLPLSQVKMQVQMWITKSEVVNEVDFLSLATFLSMLPSKRRIEDLHILLKTMHRCMTETGNCIWHRTYRKTVKYVQHYMQIEYNSNLMVPPVKCNLVWCNSDVM